MSHESALSIPVGEVTLEARWAPAPGRPLWLVGHPHPGYGGSQDNNVVIAARDALQAAGEGTLRWNCRGIGRSSGRAAGDARDAEDLRGLLHWAAARPEAAGGLALSGYSFGAWSAVTALTTGPVPPLAALMLFSPPLDFMPFPETRLPADLPCLATVGDRDGFCALPSFEAWWAAQGEVGATRTRVVLSGGDHFYGGQETALAAAIREFLRKR